VPGNPRGRGGWRPAPKPGFNVPGRPQLKIRNETLNSGTHFVVTYIRTCRLHDKFKQEMSSNCPFEAIKRYFFRFFWLFM
jgi:hypothetical protein